MALTPAQQALRWSLVLIAFIGFVWFMGGTLTPYVVALILAYFLDPLADRLEAMGLSRILAVLLITLCAIVIVAMVIVLVAPLIIGQLAALIDALPGYFERLQEFLKARFPQLFEDGHFDFQEYFGEFGSSLQTIGTSIANALISSTKGVIGLVAGFVIIPVVTFFILLDWDHLVAKIDSWLPRDHAPIIRRLLGEIDVTLAGFIRGQGTVCLIMASYYGTMLGLMGVRYGVALGVIAGILTFIPYVGAFIGASSVVLVSLYQAWSGVALVEAGGADPGWFGQSWTWFASVIALYFAGSSVEGNFITPKLVGRSVGLHPVWIIFSLSAFGATMGLTGMLIAVPVAATIGVMGRFILGQYLGSRLYLGQASLGQSDQQGDQHGDQEKG